MIAEHSQHSLVVIAAFVDLDNVAFQIDVVGPIGLNEIALVLIVLDKMVAIDLHEMDEMDKLMHSNCVMDLELSDNVLLSSDMRFGLVA